MFEKRFLFSMKCRRRFHKWIILNDFAAFSSFSDRRILWSTQSFRCANILILIHQFYLKKNEEKWSFYWLAQIIRHILFRPMRIESYEFTQHIRFTGYVLLWMRFRLIDSVLTIFIWTYTVHTHTHTRKYPNKISDKHILQATFNFYLVFDGCRDDYRMNGYVT